MGTGYTVALVLAGVAAVALLLPAEKRWPTHQPCGLLDTSEFTLYSTRVSTPEGLTPAAVHVRDGRIQWVVPSAQPPTGARQLIDYGNMVVMPGLIDTHVHLNEPGRVHWEGFVTGTKAAAAGGFSAVVDMPLNSLPTTCSRAELALKLKASRGKLAVDVGFWGGLVPENAENHTKLTDLLDAGVLGLKSFMSPSGIDDFPQTSADHIRDALPLLALRDLPILVHAELPQPLAQSDGANPRLYDTWLRSRPRKWEQDAVSALLAAANQSSEHAAARIHIVHLSDADSISRIRDARDRGAHLTVETCPHYLTFAAEDVPEGATQFKCAPPIREAENRDRLWSGLLHGDIDMVTSDHSPAPPSMKRPDIGDFLEAWGGISSLQFGLPATWTMGRSKGVSLPQLAEWWSARPADLAGLKDKGAIAAGKDADFVVWDPEATFMPSPNNIEHRHKITPYTNRTLYGKVLGTYVRGQLVYWDGVHAPTTCGRTMLSELTPVRAFAARAN